MPHGPLTKLMSFSLALLLIACMTDSAAADEFHLNNGGKIRGRWLNRGDSPLRAYHIETERGGRITLAVRQVVKQVHLQPSHAEYSQTAPTYPDTADGQWMLAQWCRQRGLRKQRQLHLQRVITLDPEHVLARRGLGYAQLHGRWVRQHEVLAEQGYVLYAGRWRVKQQVDLLKESQRVKQAERRWFIDTRRWRSQLATHLAPRAVAQFRAVRDPNAIAALARLLEEETDREVRLLFVDVLGTIRDDRTTSLLVDLTLNDHDEELFHTCVDRLVERKAPPLIKVFAEALSDPANHRVNRAGYVLGRLQDKVALEPLIDALITTHFLTLPDPSGRGAGATTTGFIRRDGAEIGDYFAVRNGPQIQEFRTPNQGVLAGLEELAGLSFGYDQRAWRNWFTLTQRIEASPSLSRKGT